MTFGEELYLAGVLAAFALFAVTLLGVTWLEGRAAKAPRQTESNRVIHAAL
jgi:hypothetical protein